MAIYFEMPGTVQILELRPRSFSYQKQFRKLWLFPFLTYVCLLT